MQIWFVAFHHANNSTRPQKRILKNLNSRFSYFVGSLHTLGKYSTRGKKNRGIPFWKKMEPFPLLHLLFDDYSGLVYDYN
jgi:hypothetical protein